MLRGIKVQKGYIKITKKKYFLFCDSLSSVSNKGLRFQQEIQTILIEPIMSMPGCFIDTT